MANVLQVLPSGCDRPVSGHAEIVQSTRIRSRRRSGRVHDHDGSDGARQIPHMTPGISGSANLGVGLTAGPGPILTERARRHLHCQPRGPGVGQPAHDHPWLRSSTPPNRASSGSASTRTWSSGSWPTPAPPWTMDGQPNLRYSDEEASTPSLRWRRDSVGCLRLAAPGLESPGRASAGGPAPGEAAMRSYTRARLLGATALAVAVLVALAPVAGATTAPPKLPVTVTDDFSSGDQVRRGRGPSGRGCGHLQGRVDEQLDRAARAGRRWRATGHNHRRRVR